MSRVLFLPLALDKRLQGQSTPLPLSVAARQIPRQLAELVAGQGAWKTSYMPLVGNEEGRRGFVGFEDLVPISDLQGILQRLQMPDLVVDGLLTEDKLELRVVSPAEGYVVKELELPFDPKKLQHLLNHLVLELWDILELPGRPSTQKAINPEVYALLLIGRDEELAVAANLTRPNSDSPFLPLLAAVEKDPKVALVKDALLLLAKHCIEDGRGDPEEAGRALAIAAAKNTDDVAFLKQASLLSRGLDRETLRHIAVPYLEHDPGHEELALTVGYSFFTEEEWEAARYVLDRAAEAHKNDASPSKNLASILALLVECHGAVNAKEAMAAQLERLLACPELAAHAADTASSRLREAERYDDALSVLERTIAKGESEGALYLELGRVHLSMGNADNARAALEKAKQIDVQLTKEADRLLDFVETPELLPNLESAERALAQEEPKEALRIAKKALKLRPDTPELHYFLGLAHSALDQPRRAIRSLEKACRLRQDFPEARNRLGILLVSVGRYQDAYEHLEDVLDARPDELGPLLHMAQACHYLKRDDEGLRYLEHAASKHGDHPLIRQTRDLLLAGH